MNVLSRILKHKVVAIIRGADPADVLQITLALKQGGVHILEVTLNSSNALPVIGHLVKKFGDEMLIAAIEMLDRGTLLEVQDADEVLIQGQFRILKQLQQYRMSL